MRTSVTPALTPIPVTPAGAVMVCPFKFSEILLPLIVNTFPAAAVIFCAKQYTPGFVNVCVAPVLKIGVASQVTPPVPTAQSTLSTPVAGPALATGADGTPT